MKHILAYLLHCANRSIQNHDRFKDAFYMIKDVILTKYGKWDGYDIQKIDGKKCNSCGGTGHHPKYSNMPPYKIYDYADCYRCWGGWYRLPKWICLRRIEFNGFTFHKPLKREECVSNPFTKQSLGWDVSDRPVIKGYIDHDSHRFGDLSIAILFLIYDRESGKTFISKWIYWRKLRVKNRIKDFVRWPLSIPKPSFMRQYFPDPNDDLPF